MVTTNPERESRRRGGPSDPLRLFARDWRLTAHCKRPGCHHQREMSVALLVRALGPETTLGKVAARLRCSECGAREPKIEARYLGRRGDGR